MFAVYKLDQFGEKLRSIREKSNLTQKEVRDYTGISDESIRRIEKGRVIPKYETLEILSQL